MNSLHRHGRNPAVSPCSIKINEVGTKTQSRLRNWPYLVSSRRFWGLKRWAKSLVEKWVGTMILNNRMCCNCLEHLTLRRTPLKNVIAANTMVPSKSRGHSLFVLLPQLRWIPPLTASRASKHRHMSFCL